MFSLMAAPRAAAVFLIVAGAGSLSAQTVPLPSGTEVIDRYVKATRSDDVIKNRRSIRTKAKTETVAPAPAAEMEEIRLAPNMMRVSVTRPGRGVLLSGFDGEHAWVQDPATGPRLFTGKDLEDRRFTASFALPLRSTTAYTTRETVEVAEFAGQKCYRVKLVSVLGRESFECFSVESGLLIAAQRKTSTPLGEQDLLLLYSEYKEFGGALIATRVVQQIMGAQQVNVVVSVTFDDVRPEEFELPPAVKALIPPW